MNDPDDLPAGHADAGAARNRAGFASEGSDEEGFFGVRSIWFKVGLYLFFLLWVGYLLYESWGFTRFEDYFFPMLIGAPVVVLIVLQLIIVLRPGIVERVRPERSDGTLEPAEPVEGTDATSRSKAEKEKFELLMIGWVLLLPIMSFYLGMGFTTLIYSFTLTAFLTRDVRTALVVTAVVILFIWLLFIQTLDMIVWEGVWELTDPFRLLSDLEF